MATAPCTCVTAGSSRRREPALKLDPRSHLEGTGAARPKNLARAAGWLAEREGLIGRRHLIEVEAVPAQVRDIEDVEGFRENRELVALPIFEYLRHADV